MLCVRILSHHPILYIFKEMDKIVHNDEKWFDMTVKKNTYYLLP
jgi:hypothetical protein